MYGKMIYNKDVLTREDILNISDIGRLNKLIGEYVADANRRVRNLSRYKGVGHREGALKQATKFAGTMAGLPGADLNDITFSAPNSPLKDVRQAQRLLGNLASYIRSPYSTIAGAGKELNRIKLSQSRGAKETINKALGHRAVTIKSLMGLSDSDWDNIRRYIDKFYGMLDSGDIIDNYVSDVDKKELEGILDVLAQNRHTERKLDNPEWSMSL